VVPVIEDPPFFEDIIKANGKANGHGYTNGDYTNGHANGSSGPSGGTIVFDRLAAVPITDIPPRPWAYGNFLLFGCASVIGAVDGGGKGSLAVTIALSMITGRPLLGERVWRTGPVAILNYEDDVIEWQRRIAAACLHYDIDYPSVVENFYFLRRNDGVRIRLAAHAINGGGLIFPDRETIIAGLKEIEPVLWIIDPWNLAHALADGNSNALMAQTAGETGHIARVCNVVALALHHLRKSATGDIDDLMGATSLRATFRSARILSRMTADEAQKLLIPSEERWRYSRIAGHKENYAPPPEQSTWYRLESVELGNGAGIYVDGDNVQVLTLVDDLPDAFDGLSRTTIGEIFEKLRAGPSPGEFYKPRRNADDWAGNIIIMIAGKTAQEADRILFSWDKNKVLLRDKYLSPATSRYRERVLVNEAKAAEILGPLYRPPAEAP
jgi:hypothetical protein